jgi:hypothetical protein
MISPALHPVMLLLQGNPGYFALSEITIPNRDKHMNFVPSDSKSDLGKNKTAECNS